MLNNWSRKELLDTVAEFFVADAELDDTPDDFV
jgi:hypothetical protein